MSSLYSRKDLSSRSRKSLSDSPPSSPSPSTKTFRQDRASRSDSSGVESPSDRLSARTGTYTRRENRLASLSKTDDNSASKDYKKLYEDALAENEKLKSRLDDSKLELTKIRSQLDRVAQEKEALEKKVSDMEEELKTPSVRFRYQS
ncbi:protein phosphatase 1 regulatory subunit 12B isoform X7 [Rhinichthys klamathensis goyatoka]|uniref:protein phosphatase 1 regulatory subunit 12B isoform X7 n=1 Tax=Rhinichthys klamathensis goyatoka TaxID=3034132 RepID=UPI0024B4AB41|nr:protein phosphatase 1 regulatory subunit 12B isoform X7 [Rhinichthys klamathensis goyatoka]